MSIVTRCGCTGRIVRVGNTVWVYDTRYGWHDPAGSAWAQHQKYRPVVLMNIRRDAA